MKNLIKTNGNYAIQGDSRPIMQSNKEIAKMLEDRIREKRLNLQYELHYLFPNYEPISLKFQKVEKLFEDYYGYNQTKSEGTFTREVMWDCVKDVIITADETGVSYLQAFNNYLNSLPIAKVEVEEVDCVDSSKGWIENLTKLKITKIL